MQRENNTNNRNRQVLDFRCILFASSKEIIVVSLHMSGFYLEFLSVLRSFLCVFEINPHTYISYIFSHKHTLSDASKIQGGGGGPAKLDAIENSKSIAGKHNIFLFLRIDKTSSQAPSYARRLQSETIAH